MSKIFTIENDRNSNRLHLKNDAKVYLSEMMNNISNEREYRQINRRDKILLMGFKSNIHKFKLTEEITIRKGTVEELQEFYDHIKASNVRNQEFILEYQYCENSENLYYPKKLFKLLDDFNIFSQIFFEGKTKVSHVQMHLLIDNQYQPSGFSSNNKVSNYIESDFDLTLDNCSNLVEFWSRFQDQFENRTMQIAFRRFLFSVEKHEYEDQIVDLMISFEAFFVKKKERRISQKVSERTAKLLSKFYNQSDVYSFLRKTYEVRSEIVHGSSFELMEIGSKQKFLELGGLVRTLSDLLVECFYLKIIDFTLYTNEELIDELDKV